MPFDVFVAPAQCPNCDALQIAEIQTHIRDGAADGSALGIGYEIDAVDLETDSLVGDGYLLIRPPEVGEPIRLLDTWSCSNCRTDQWAVVEIADRRVRSVTPVTLDGATLDSANFIAEIDAEILAEYLRGDEPASRDGVVGDLRRFLPGTT